MRTAWITRLGLYSPTDDAMEALDRYGCFWEGPPGPAYRRSYGPSCVDLRTALEWADQHASAAFVEDDVLGERWSVGAPREGCAQLRTTSEPSVVARWDATKLRTWTVRSVIEFGPRDFAEAMANYGATIEHRNSHTIGLDPDPPAIHLQVSIEAPDEWLACELAHHVALSTLTGDDGLRDERSDGFAARETQAMPSGSR